MTPIYEGGSLRILGADDIKGMLKIYEVDDGSSCSGPYRQGEPCSHNCNCVTNLKCISIDDGPNLCTATCNGENAECPGNLPCVLGATPLNGGFPKGICIPNIFDGLYPEASICGADTQCKSGLCSPNDVFGRSACIKNCEVHVDCENGFSCHENICVAREIIVGTDCPQTENFEEAQCGCSSLNNYPSRNGIFFLIGILLIIKFIIRQKFQT